MQSMFFRILGAVITLLLLAALILVVVLTMRTEHVAIPTATARPLPTATASPTMTADPKSLGGRNTRTLRERTLLQPGQHRHDFDECSDPTEP